MVHFAQLLKREGQQALENKGKKLRTIHPFYNSTNRCSIITPLISISDMKQITRNTKKKYRIQTIKNISKGMGRSDKVNNERH